MNCTTEQTTKEEIIRVMNTLIHATQDEDLIDIWLMLVPDGADNTDLKEIAEDEELFKAVVTRFIGLSKYFQEGINLFGRWYK